MIFKKPSAAGRPDRHWEQCGKTLRINYLEALILNHQFYLTGLQSRVIALLPFTSRGGVVRSHR